MFVIEVCSLIPPGMLPISLLHFDQPWLRHCQEFEPYRATQCWSECTKNEFAAQPPPLARIGVQKFASQGRIFYQQRELLSSDRRYRFR